MSSCAIFKNGNPGSIEYTRSKSRWAPVCWPDACFAKARTQRSKRSGSVRFRRRSGSRLVSSRAMPGRPSRRCAKAKTASSKASRSSTSGHVDADEAPASGESRRGSYLWKAAMETTVRRGMGPVQVSSGADGPPLDRAFDPGPRARPSPDGSHRETGASMASRRRSRASTHLPHQLPRLWPVLPPYRAASQGNVADPPCTQGMEQMKSESPEPHNSFSICRSVATSTRRIVSRQVV